MGGSVDPNANNPFNKMAGPLGWLIGIVTGVGFIGLLYQSATGHHDDGHGDGHGDAHAADHAADHGDHAAAGDKKADDHGDAPAAEEKAAAPAAEEKADAPAAEEKAADH